MCVKFYTFLIILEVHVLALVVFLVLTFPIIFLIAIVRKSHHRKPEESVERKTRGK